MNKLFIGTLFVFIGVFMMHDSLLKSPSIFCIGALFMSAGVFMMCFLVLQGEAKMTDEAYRRIRNKLVEGRTMIEVMAENERLREALKKIASVNSVQAGPDKDMYRRWRKAATDAIDVARAALSPEGVKHDPK